MRARALGERFKIGEVPPMDSREVPSVDRFEGMKRCRVCETVLRDTDTACAVCGAIQHPSIDPAPMSEGQTVFHASGEQRTPSGEVIFVQAAPTGVVEGPTHGSRTWTIAFSVLSAAVVVTLAVLVTILVRRPAPPPPTPPPISDVKITYPPNGAQFGAQYPLVLQISVEGDGSKVDRIEAVVDGKVAQSVPGKKEHELIVDLASNGTHQVVAKATYVGSDGKRGEKLSKPIQVTRI